MSPKTASENAALLSAAAVLKLNTCYKEGHTGYEAGLTRTHAKTNVRESMGLVLGKKWGQGFRFEGHFGQSRNLRDNWDGTGQLFSQGMESGFHAGGPSNVLLLSVPQTTGETECSKAF